jgi:hypothetical protein
VAMDFAEQDVVSIIAKKIAASKRNEESDK